MRERERESITLLNVQLVFATGQTLVSRSELDVESTFAGFVLYFSFDLRGCLVIKRCLFGFTDISCLQILRGITLEFKLKDKYD